MSVELEMNGTEPVNRGIHYSEGEGSSPAEGHGLGEKAGQKGNPERKRLRSARTASRSHGRKGILSREQAVRRAQKAGSAMAATAAGNAPSLAGETRSQEVLGHTGSRYKDKGAVRRLEQHGKAAASVGLGQKVASAWKMWLDGLRRKSIISIGIAVALAVLAGTYIYTAVFFGSHFYPGTFIHSVDCSKMELSEAKAAVQNQMGTYSLQVLGRDNRQDTITADMIGMTYSDEKELDRALSSQKSFLWPLMMLVGKKQVDIHTDYDKEHIENVIRSLDEFQPDNITKPEDARLGETDEGYVIIPEVMGNEPDREKVSSAIREALDSGAASVSLDEKGCYVAPAVYSDDAALKEEADRYNPFMGAKITLNFGDRQEVVGTSMIRSFISTYQDGTDFVDSEKIFAYVQDLSDKYDTYGGHRTFYSTIGTVEELYGGDYGWMLDQTATTQMILEGIRNKEVGQVDPIYIHTAMDRGVNDLGDTYIEICISRQEMWCYQNGYLMVDTPVVTGNPSNDHETPSGGVWAIDGKFTNYTLVGEDYRAPVDFWMPFNEDVGIHDLSNRYYYGGDIYLYAGSHGCVNTPLAAVEEIFNLVDVGTPVVIYE